MAAVSGSNSQVTDGTLVAARQTVRTERREILDELEAFSTFQKRVAGLSVTPLETENNGLLLRRTATTPAIETIRAWYEETVMSVSHYQKAYQDTYYESILEEFSPAVAIVLAKGTRFDDRCKRLLVEGIANARSRRTQFLETLTEQCRQIAVERQATIRAHRRDFMFTSESIDLHCYLYADLEATYPVLSCIASLTEHREVVRRAVERAIGNCY